MPQRSKVAGVERPAGRGGAFTLVELLVVIAVLGIMITVITLVAGRTIYNQRKANTLGIMRSASMAIDQFAQLNPLASIYNRHDRATFGPYPPYMLKGARSAASVRGVLDPGPTFNTLSERVLRDLTGQRNPPNPERWVRLNDGDENDDARALYIYLRAFAPDAVGSLPPDRLKPLDPQRPEYVNPSGQGPEPGADGSAWFDVLALHDAWDVPLDYLLYVRLKRVADPQPGNATAVRYVVVDRRAVLRSRGVKREVWQAGGDDPQRWLFSEPLPKPWAQVARDGQIQNNSEGWVRAVGARESYNFIPDQDLQ